MRQPKKQISSPAIRSTSQLARELGLSRWTVSRVINGHPGIHPDTVERVRAAMEKHRFSPNPLAQGLRRGRTHLIGICAPDVDDYFLGPKLDLLRQSLVQRGFQAMIGITGSHTDSETLTLDHFRRLCVSGVVLFASRLAPGHSALEQFKEANIPLVMVDPLVSRHPHCLSIDRTHASRELMTHLTSLGHRHFLTVGMENAGLYTRTRLAAIKSFLEEQNLPVATHLTHLRLPETGSDYALGYESAADVATQISSSNQNPPPTAILTINDRVALGLMAGLRERGLEAPRDYSIAGYDNMEHTAYISPRLTTVDPGAPELMEKAAARLLAALQAENTPPRATAIKPRLLIRETSAPPRQKTA